VKSFKSFIRASFFYNFAEQVRLNKRRRVPNVFAVFLVPWAVVIATEKLFPGNCLDSG